MRFQALFIKQNRFKYLFKFMNKSGDVSVRNKHLYAWNINYLRLVRSDWSLRRIYSYCLIGFDSWSLIRGLRLAITNLFYWPTIMWCAIPSYITIGLTSGSWLVPLTIGVLWIIVRKCTCHTGYNKFESNLNLVVYGVVEFRNSEELWVIDLVPKK